MKVRKKISKTVRHKSIPVPVTTGLVFIIREKLQETEEYINVITLVNGIIVKAPSYVKQCAPSCDQKLRNENHRLGCCLGS
jgi:hypothetical protein